jgi:EmrB/QacA subfamily drug resistance transporter
MPSVSQTTVPDLSVPAVETRRTSPDRSRPHKWWILGIVGVAQLMVVLDGTIVNIALPSAQADLGFSDASRQWVVTGYALAFGSLLLLGGRIADLLGRKPVFLVGLVGFAVASAIGGAAVNFEMLVTARVAQGAFGALLAPAALSLLTTTFTDAKERAKAFSIYGSIAGAGGAVGLLLGGVLTEYLDWRWTLYVNLVFAAVAFIGGALLLGRTARDKSASLDVPGTLLVSSGLFGLVYGIANAETDGWAATGTWGFMLAGGILLAVFAWWQTRASHPLLPLRILLDRTRGASLIAILVSGAGLFGMFLFLTYYLQITLGYSPVETGLAFMPMVGALMVAAIAASNIAVPRLGPKPVIPAGMALAAGGMLLLTGLGLDSTYATNVLPALLIVGAGMGLVMAPSMSLSTAGVGTEDAGVASAAVNAMQQIGGSLGTALLTTVAASAAADHLAGKDPTNALVQAGAALASYDAAFVLSAGMFVAGLFICALLFPRGVPDHDEDATPVIHM